MGSALCIRTRTVGLTIHEEETTNTIETLVAAPDAHAHAPLAGLVARNLEAAHLGCPLIVTIAIPPDPLATVMTEMGRISTTNGLIPTVVPGALAPEAGDTSMIRPGEQ